MDFVRQLDCMGTSNHTGIIRSGTGEKAENKWITSQTILATYTMVGYDSCVYVNCSHHES